MSDEKTMQEDVLNKGALVAAMIDEFGAGEKGDFASKAAADRIVRGVFAMMAKALSEGKVVRIQDFGSFETYKAEARTGRNPQNGEAIEIPAATRVRFSASKALKAAVNG